MMNETIRKMDENATIRFLEVELIAPHVDKVAEERKLYLTDAMTATEALNDSYVANDEIELICAKCEDYALNEYVTKYAKKYLNEQKAPQYKYNQILLPYYAYGYACQYFWEYAVGEYVADVFG